jgi:hypothetical protein
LAINAWLDENLVKMATCLNAVGEIKKVDFAENKSAMFVGAFQVLLSKLLAYREDHQDQYIYEGQLPVLHAIGESHSLPAANTIVTLNGVKYRIQTQIVIGCKAWHLANGSANRYKQQFEVIANSIHDKEDVMIILGEIDCLINEGIIKHHRKTKNDLAAAVNRLSQDYIGFVANIFAGRGCNIIIAGIPAIPVLNKKLSAKDVVIWSKTVKLLNSGLKMEAVKNGMQFLDLHSITRAKNL